MTDKQIRKKAKEKWGDQVYCKSCKKKHIKEDIRYLAWEYHLVMILMSKDPIKYLKKHL